MLLNFDKMGIRLKRLKLEDSVIAIVKDNGKLFLYSNKKDPIELPISRDDMQDILGIKDVMKEINNLVKDFQCS